MGCIKTRLRGEVVAMTLLFLLSTLVAHRIEAATVHRSPGETDARFVARVTGQSLHASTRGQAHLATSDQLVPGHSTVVALTDRHAPGERDFDLQLNVLVATDAGAYDRAEIDACEIEGGSPTARAFFFANADAEPDLEIGVICGWDAAHVGAECGQHDEVRFFKLEKSGGRMTGLAPLDDSRFKAFYGTERSAESADVTCDVAKFKTVADVRKLLARLKPGGNK